jgi:predicted dithiol-disulfide oxidoreductase (DUF899 family)
MTDHTPHTPPLPQVTDRASWQAQLDELAVREKAHTREGDKIAAARDVTYAIFSQGPYEQSRAYHDFLDWDVPWYSARDSAEQLLAGRWFGMRVSYVRQDDRVFETYWTTGRGVERAAPSYAILDETVYGRQETWEDSPEGWPKEFGVTGEQFRVEGRPTAQWVRLTAGKPEPF